MPSGRLALVDFEEVGPGDPMVDVANLLAHLRWMARFGSAAEQRGDYRAQVRSTAIDRFGWSGRDLALREAYALYRLSSNPIRQLRRDWPSAVEAGLALSLEALADAA